MVKRKLGKNGDEVSVIGFGAWPIGGGMGPVEERAAVDTVHAAVDSGITLIDTAQAYRASEALLGKALSGGLRSKVFLATKASFDFSPKGLREAIENSLRNLRTDYVDLYQLHAFREDTPVEDSMDELARLQGEGKLRFIGVSNFSAAQMDRALRTTRFESNQPRYNIFDREIEAADIPYCTGRGIGVLAHSVFAKGLLTGKYSADSVFPPEDERSQMPRFSGEQFRTYLTKAERLREVASDYGLTPVQLALAWVLRNPAVTCALAGAKNPGQIEEQVAAAGVALPEDALSRIDAVSPSPAGQ